jgi:hypothetical protein
MRRFPPAPLLLAVLSAFPAQAQVHRCTAADGTQVFTDRRCDELGAVERAPPPAPSTGGARVHRTSCAHNLRDLTFELTSALDSRDVNRLAGIYHWVGMTSDAADAVMDRLDAIVQRPLVDVVPVYSGGDADEGLGGDYYPQATVRRTPVGLRLEQTLGNSGTPARTTFGLRRYLGCWWISL